MTALDRDFDAITIEQLRAQKSEKWSQLPVRGARVPADRDVIAAWVAEMDFGTAPVVHTALDEAIQKHQYGYVSPPLIAEFREAFADFARRRYGWALRPEQVRQVPDVLGGVEAMVRFLIHEDHSVVLPTPAATMPFKPLLDSLEQHVIQVPMIQDADGRWINDLAGIEAAFAAGATWLVLVNPHNPTGRVFTRDELEALADIVTRYDGRVFADEIHAPLVYPGGRHIPYASLSSATAAHTVTAASASKAWNMPGLKAAQIILTNDDDLAIWRANARWMEHLTATIGVIGQTAAYREGEPWLVEVLEYLGENRRLVGEFLAARLPRVGYMPPEGTYLTWLDLRDYRLARPALWLLENAGVALTEGSDCGAAGSGFVRLNIAAPRPILIEALERIAAALESLDGAVPSETTRFRTNRT